MLNRSGGRRQGTQCAETAIVSRRHALGAGESVRLEHRGSAVEDLIVEKRRVAGVITAAGRYLSRALRGPDHRHLLKGRYPSGRRADARRAVSAITVDRACRSALRARLRHGQVQIRHPAAVDGSHHRLRQAGAPAGARSAVPVSFLTGIDRTSGRLWYDLHQYGHPSVIGERLSELAVYGGQ